MKNFQIAMRYLQVVGFILGLVAFLASALYTGQQMGDTLWKIGVGCMISDITLILLWSTKK